LGGGQLVATDMKRALLDERAQVEGVDEVIEQLDVGGHRVLLGGSHDTSIVGLPVDSWHTSE
jgi:hypothetical protein